MAFNSKRMICPAAIMREKQGGAFFSSLFLTLCTAVINEKKEP